MLLVAPATLKVTLRSAVGMTLPVDTWKTAVRLAASSSSMAPPVGDWRAMLSTRSSLSESRAVALSLPPSVLTAMLAEFPVSALERVTSRVSVFSLRVSSVAERVRVAEVLPAAISIWPLVAVVEKPVGVVMS